jgi:hypothetical protein
MNATANVVPLNKLTMNDLTTLATDLGAEAGRGKDTQIKMLMKLVEGGYHSAVDTDKNKYGLGVDDATKLAEAYVKAQTGANIFDAKAPNQRKTISCFRTCIKLGAWPKGGNGEPLATMNELMTIRQKLKQNPTTAKKLKDAANTLLEYARVQVKRDQLVSHGELHKFCVKTDAEERDAEELVEAARNSLQKLHDGKAAKGTAQDNSPEVQQAINVLTKRLKDIAAARRVDSQGNAV